MAVRLLFIISDKRVVQSTERMRLVEFLTLITVIFLLPLLTRFKSSDIQRLKAGASEGSWYVSASCPKQASPPVFFAWHV